MVIEIPSRDVCMSCGEVRTEDQLGACTLCGVPVCGLFPCTGDHNCIAEVLKFPAD